MIGYSQPSLSDSWQDYILSGVWHRMKSIALAFAFIVLLFCYTNTKMTQLNNVDGRAMVWQIQHFRFFRNKLTSNSSHCTYMVPQSSTSKCDYQAFLSKFCNLSIIWWILILQFITVSNMSDILNAPTTAILLITNWTMCSRLSTMHFCVKSLFAYFIHTVYVFICNFSKQVVSSFYHYTY